MLLPAVLLLLAGGAAALPPTSIPPTRGSPPVAGTELLRNERGQSARYTGIGQLHGALDCTAWLVDTPGKGPAYAVANGHCTSLSPSETIVNRPASGVTIEFGRFVDTPDARLKVAVKRIAWSSMKGVDLGIFELDRSLAALRANGIRPLRIASRPPAAGREVESVGLPVVGVPQDQQSLRRSRCTTGVTAKRLIEERWLWYGSVPNDCKGITGGSSGSPLLDRTSGDVLGAINTTTFLGENLTPCYSGRPCEVRGGRLRTLRNTTYAIPVAGLRSCFTSTGRFRLGGACPLDTRSWLTTIAPPVGVNPDVIDPLSNTPQKTWKVRLEGSGLAYYRTKVVAAGSADCRTPTGYGVPVALAKAPVYDAPLPTRDGRWVLCILAGPSAKLDKRWQPAANATSVIRYIDRVPPSRRLRVNVKESSTGSTFEPIFDLPEQALFQYKFGSPSQTTCTDPAGYRPYRRFPIQVPAQESPAKACVRSWDEAGNEVRQPWEGVIDGRP